MRIEQLQYLMDLSFTNSINNSASRLFVTPPTISDAIQKLENELGVPLLIRSRKGVQLTSAGKSVVADSKIIFQQLKALRENALKASLINKNDLEGELIIGALPISDNWILPEAISQFLQVYPKIQLISYDDSPTNLANDLKQQKIDIAFINRTIYPNKEFKNNSRENIINDPQYNVKIYYKEPMIGIRSADKFETNKISFQDFLQHPSVTMFSGKSNGIEKDCIFPNIGLQTNNSVVFCNAVLNQSYYSILPLSSLKYIFSEDDYASLQIVQFKETIMMEYYYLTLADNVLREEELAFLNFITLFFKNKS